MRPTTSTPASLRALFLLTLLLGPISPPGQASEGSTAAVYPGYLPLEGAIVVNLASEGRTRYLKIEIQFYLETSHDAELVGLHAPLIRNRLIELLGGRSPEQILSKDARDQLRKELLEKLREAMIRQAGVPAIRDLFFNDFIVQ